MSIIDTLLSHDFIFDRNRIHCETSYLPFIFYSGREADEPSEEEDHVKSEPTSPEFVKPSGRRTFDDGREVIVSWASMSQSIDDNFSTILPIGHLPRPNRGRETFRNYNTS